MKKFYNPEAGCSYIAIFLETIRYEIGLVIMGVTRVPLNLMELVWLWEFLFKKYRIGLAMCGFPSKDMELVDAMGVLSH